MNAILWPSSLAVAVLATGCLNVDRPSTYVDLQNAYPAASTGALVVYEAQWQSVSFSTAGDPGWQPLAPGASSDVQTAFPASANTAYAVLAPGWDPTSTTPPTAFVVLQSRSGFSLALDQTLHIPVDDDHFAGNCASGNALTQAQTDFVTRIVFAGTFAGLHYDAATCTTTPAPASDGGSP